MIEDTGIYGRGERGQNTASLFPKKVCVLFTKCNAVMVLYRSWKYSLDAWKLETHDYARISGKVIARERPNCNTSQSNFLNTSINSLPCQLVSNFRPSDTWQADRSVNQHTHSECGDRCLFGLRWRQSSRYLYFGSFLCLSYFIICTNNWNVIIMQIIIK